jgi:hypothetical protein
VKDVEESSSESEKQVERGDWSGGGGLVVPPPFDSEKFSRRCPTRATLNIQCL